MAYIKLDPEVEKVVVSVNQKEAECSACGRYIGSWEICPFCRHYNPKRLPVRIVKYSMPFLTILGLFLLAHLGKIYGIQEIKISELGRKCNFAQVEILGRVSDEIRFHSSDADTERGVSRSLEFEVDDGTGIIRIRSYEDVFEELQKAGNIPGIGDRVRLYGNYQYKARRQFIILGSSDNLFIERDRPTNAIPIRIVEAFEYRDVDEGQRVRITGRVRGISKGAYDRTWWLTDPSETASLAVTLSEGVLDAFGPQNEGVVLCEKLQKGDLATCFGVLRLSRGRTNRYWTLIPAAPSDLIRADETTWKEDNGTP